MIISIRGTSGSGKTHLVRDLIHKKHGKPFIETLSGKETIAGYKLQGKIYVIGKYLDTSTCGGCDTIRYMNDVEYLVDKYCKKGHVVFEGMIVSHTISRWLEFSKRNKKYGPFMWVTMDTPLDICYKRIYKRNGGKEFKRCYVDDTYHRSIRTMEKMSALGEDTCYLEYKKAKRQLRDLLYSR